MGSFAVLFVKMLTEGVDHQKNDSFMCEDGLLFMHAIVFVHSELFMVVVKKKVQKLLLCY